MHDVNELMAAHVVPGLSFEKGQGGLTKAVFAGPDCSGEIYLQGAHVTKWQPRGQSDVLWVSRSSWFEPGKPIRGGVPICCPWFGAHPLDAALPAHGTARLIPWNLNDVRSLPDSGVQLVLTAEIEQLSLEFCVTFGAVLKMCLTVTFSQAATGPISFEAALHSYFAVTDVRKIQIEGLEAASYFDKMDGAAIRPPMSRPIRIVEETDRVYFDTDATCVVCDPDAGRSVVIRKSGSLSTVVWNPWIAKAQRMPDFGDHEWTDMVCVETANVGPNAITLQPGHSHPLTVEIAVQSAE